MDNGPSLAPTPPPYDQSRQYAYAISEFPVQAADTENVEPEFQDGDGGLGGVQVLSRVLENFPDLPTVPVTQLRTEMSIFSAVQLATNAAQDTTPGEFI